MRQEFTLVIEDRIDDDGNDYCLAEVYEPAEFGPPVGWGRGDTPDEAMADLLRQCTFEEVDA